MDKSILKNKNLDGRVTEFLIPQTHRKSISPLIVSDGFVYGWAFDPLRTTITVALSVDGVEQVSGLTGHNVADEFYAQHTPPTSTCGFVLPLPNEALGGFMHQLTIKVTEWHSTPLAPEASETWHHGNIFGEVKYTQQGFVEGWVGFRSAIDTAELPPVSVSQEGQIHYAIQLAYASPASSNGCQVMGQFRVLQSQFATLGQPVFSCLGTTLRLYPDTPRFKPVGQIDAIDHEGIRGWVLNNANPLETVDLQLVVDGLPLRALRPNVRRKDIADYLNLLPEEIGISGFHIGLPIKLKDGLPHTISVYCRKDGTALNKQPLNYQHTMHGINLQQAHALLGNSGSQTEEPTSNSQTVTLDISKLELDQSIKQSPQVAVIILNRNGAPCLEALFESWLRYNTIPVELIVIDHASTDASLATVKRWASKLPIQTVVLDKNDSFSASSNRGARLAKAPFVLFLNNDIVLLQDILPSLLDTLHNPQVGVVGLKLLKTELAEHRDNAALSSAAEVQHLGVRFTLVGDQYWPYETSPDSDLLEEQYSPQDVPIVTGAVMLCRRDEFLAMGGFDEGYFYGYEDVEFCLRMSVQRGSRIVCRNDLTALHHHGYTRLTGREPSMIDHQLDNQTRLADQLGLWSKRAFWQSLLDADSLLSNEKLTVGFAVHNTEGKTQLAAAVELAERIYEVYPNVKTVFLTSDNSWNQVDSLHVLVSLSPCFDLRCLKQARSDLRTGCYITHENDLNAWSINPGLDLFDSCLCVDHALAIKAEKSMRGIARPVVVSNKTPLADLLDANRLRVLLRVPLTPKLIGAAKQLTQALKIQGALVCKVEPDGWNEQSKVVEVVITLHGSPSEDTPALLPYQRRNDVINVLWIVEDAVSLRASELTQADQVWLAIPKLPQHLKKSAVGQRSVGLQTELMQGLAEHLQNAVEKKIERTFRTS